MVDPPNTKAQIRTRAKRLANNQRRFERRQAAREAQVGKTYRYGDGNIMIKLNTDGTLTVDLLREDVLRIIISRAIFSAQEAGHTIDIDAVRLGAFTWGPGMSARITLPLRANAEVRAAGPRVEGDIIPQAASPEASPESEAVTNSSEV